jgi:hypothetical protein
MSDVLTELPKSTEVQSERTPARQPSTPPVETDDFAKLVERCRTHKLADIIENTSVQHATILMRGLLKHAAAEKTNVQIVSGKLFPGVFELLVPTLQDALDNGCKVEVVTLCPEEDLEGNEFYSTLMHHPNARAYVAGKQQKEYTHFLLSGNAYRLEVDDGTKKAYASFNDQDGILPAYLSDIFARWKKSLGVEGEGWSSRAKRTA